MLKQILVLIFIINLGVSVASAQPEGETEPGKCYAKCMILSKPEAKELTFYALKEYRADLDTDIKTITYNKEVLDYVKRVHHMHRDSVIWEMNLDNPDIKTYEVLDEAVLENLAPELIDTICIVYQEWVSESKTYQWREVLCDGAVTNYTVRQMADKLDYNGIIEIGTNVFDDKLKDALIDYQYKHRLPIGNLDIETLDHLEVNY